MAENHDYKALEWVKGEIEETLKQAQQALEAFVENPDDATRMRFCLTHLHQVYGTLQMVEFYGAALLAEEMEQLALAMQTGKVAVMADAQDVLMRAILQLPAYLERVKTGRRDAPLVILPLLNDLRAARGEPLLSETAMFKPDLTAGALAVPVEMVSEEVENELVEVLKKIRQLYQFALVGIIRGQDLPANLGHMAKALAKLEQVYSGKPMAQVWWVGSALIEGVSRNAIELGTSVKALLGLIDRQLKQSIDADAGRDEALPVDLLKNMLYYIARCESDTPRIRRVKEAFRLDDALPGEEFVDRERRRLSGPDRDTVVSVITVLLEEIVQVKDALDAFLVNDKREARELKPMVTVLKQVGDALAVLGLGNPRRVVLEQLDIIAKAVETGQLPPDVIFMDVAGALLYVEATLQGIAADGGREGFGERPAEEDVSAVSSEHVSKARAAVIEESRAGLQSVKDAVMEYIGARFDTKFLAAVPEVLASVRGGLAMVPLPYPAELLESCLDYIVKDLVGARKTPDWRELDTFADAITSVEYYLERLGDDYPGDVDILAIAEDAVAALGHPIAHPTRTAVVTTRSVVTLDDVIPDEDVPHIDIPELTETVSADRVAVMTAAPAVVEAAEAGLEDDIVELDFGDPVDLDVPELELELEGDDVSAAPPAISIVVPPQAPVSVAVKKEAEPAAGEADPEVLEIFIEEAAEVLDTIREYLPKWRMDPSDHASRAEVRRGFHTLKGSGRLVGARQLGELAWSVENMLNRVIDGGISLAPPVFGLIDSVVAVMPELVEAFRDQRPSATDVSTLEATGHAISKGLPPPVAAVPVAPVAAPELSVSDEELDPVLIDIFVQEARSHLQSVEEFLAQSTRHASAFSAEVLRALHTLKGSAHMAGITGIAELAAPTEKFIKECHVQGVHADADIQALLKDFGDILQTALMNVERYASTSVPAAAAVVERITGLRHAKLRHAEDAPGPSEVRPDKQLISMFLAEGSDLIVDAGDVLRHWEENPVPGEILDNLRRDLRVLARSAGAARLSEVVALCMALEEVYDAAADGLLAPGAAFFEVAHRAHEHLVDMMDRIAVGQAAGSVDELVVALQSLLDHAQAVKEQIGQAEAAPATLAKVAAPATVTSVATPSVPVGEVLEAADDPELVEIFLEEAADIMESTANTLHDWIEMPDDLDKVASLQRDLHTLKGGARMSGFRQIGDLAHHLENLYEGLVEKRFHAAASLFDLLHRCHDTLAVMVETVTGGRQPAAAPDLIDAIGQWMKGGTPVQASTPAPAPAPAVTPTLVQAPVAVSLTKALPASLDSAEIDTEILDIFLEEAEELAEGIDHAIHAWEGDRDNREPLTELLRLLHTLKGGARLAGLSALGNAAHEFETLLMRLETESVTVDDAFFAGIHTSHDAMFACYQQVKSGEIKPDAEPLVGTASDVAVTPVVATPVAPAPVVQVPAAAPAPVAVAPEWLPPVAERPAPVWHEDEDGRPTAPSESIRVPAELVESLVNLAGETSIIRSRIETELSDFNYVIGEIGQTVDRVRELLRRLDIETETQILANHQQTGLKREYEDFDPLEMDRYSGLHHLSRALGESVSDLLDLKDSLSHRSRVAETLLVQQSRINTELQEGLMRTRMVPFTRLTPRLRRIVRQIAGELGKKADLEIIGAEGEMDRTVMDRLVAPLEHMLRNSVDHGIELPEERVAAGKKEQGRITLHLSREGGEVVLRLSDDGRGIPLDKVRKRAVERGLMRPDAQISDKEMLQFIFRPGFSTAEKVTQISGRGVGMDVVHSEIKQLNGTIKIHSYAGAGSQFTVRLPFTVSVNRALMVRVGEDAYAIPLNNIEGIVRISPYELESYYGPDAPEFEYAGSKYRLRYLGGYVHDEPTPNLAGITKPLPVLLVRGTDHATALQVDSLIGSREVVVKAVGPQLAAVSGISGATILGDGSVVIILDISAMIRAEQAQASAARVAPVSVQPVADVTEVADDDAGSTPVVMVIDDSVTVRKVTSRLLERHGYEVVTAKDGVDAISQLQDMQPDIMLLDIEMPRMDGFEVATLVRHDDRLKDTPIIMITSRTGEKHRERALTIGVDRYMGKPYQETQLLENIRDLLKKRVPVHGD